jgi:hypothetical protein
MGEGELQQDDGECMGRQGGACSCTEQDSIDWQLGRTVSLLLTCSTS